MSSESFLIIPLGKWHTKIDREDLLKTAAHRWHAANKGHGYVCAVTAQAQGVVSLHRYLMGVTDPRLIIDHINGDPLDNRRANLRVCTRGENQANMRKHKDSKSAFKGLVLHSDTRRKKRWVARVCKGGTIVHCSYHETEVGAARAYDAAAKKHFGLFAKTNFND